MSDLSELLPNFDQKPWKHLMFSLEKKGITSSELIGCDPRWLSKFIPLPLRELERMAAAVTRAFHEDLKTRMRSTKPDAQSNSVVTSDAPKPLHIGSPLRFITTLDTNIDEFLGGGIPTGYVTEIVGESAAGKSQFAHALLLAATLKPRHGLRKTALYITTEDDLMTIRLEQILQTNPTFKTLSDDELPNLDHIFTIKVNTLAEQESIIAHRLRPEIRRRNIGLVVIDSITAHFRAQFGGNNPKVLAARAVELQNLGNSLQQLAHEDNVAVVVTNQVSDRFDDIRSIRVRNQASSIGRRSTPSITELNRTQPTNLASQARRERLLSLDHQQMFFTGWGDDLSHGNEQMKTPALGLAWTNQLDARIALKVVENSGYSENRTSLGKDSRTRFMKVVFAKWTAPSRIPLRYELHTGGVAGITEVYHAAYNHIKDEVQKLANQDDSQFLDPKYWEDDLDLDEQTA